jgi:formate hydrogenlyase subunit 5
MLAQETTETLRQKIEGQFTLEGVHNGSLNVVVPPHDVVKAAEFIRDELDGRFVVSAGTDKRELSGGYEVLNIFSLDHLKCFLFLRTMIDTTDPHVPSFTPAIPGAGWAEREVRDMIGVHPIGHPNPERLVLPDDWPEDIYPLRRDFKYNSRPHSVPDAKPKLKPPPKDTSVFPIGPFFPTLEEPVFINLFVNGENIVDMDYRGFFNHRGVEKLGDSSLTYNQVCFIAERICGICGCVHSACYCEAVESASEIVVPQRAHFIRTILLELERLHSHLLWAGLACHFIGFDTLFMQAWRIREPVMWLTEYITGNRKTYGMNLIGGVSRDLPEDYESHITPVINRIEEETTSVIAAIIEDGSLKARLQGSGILTKEEAKALCVVGPTARGSGLAIDSRVDHPYAAYAELDFEVCVEESCDNWARTLVRLREVLEAVKIIRQALALMPDGPVMAEVKEIPPWKEGVCSVEAPRGEAHHYVLTSPEQRPYRWRVRAPTYNNLQGIPAMLKNMTIADAPICVGSIDPCFSCTERIAVIDKQSGLSKIYTKEELLRMFNERAG